MATNDRRTVLIIGISRGIGRGLTAEYLRRGWSVIGTVRTPASDTSLQAMADGTPGHLRVEHLDMTRPQEIAALHELLAGEHLDVLLVNAGTPDGNVPVAEIDEAAFNQVMSTNALAPMKVIEALQDLVREEGTIAAMSSNQGSITLNAQGGFDVYRASKTALNQLMRSYAARHHEKTRTLLLLTPGWVQTDLGGPSAPQTVEQSVAGLIATIDANQVPGELRFVDYRNETVPW
jgi:NAD(P)-dependent dehydrogenase (short-subunit alcohol dehydrogenase family)